VLVALVIVLLLYFFLSLQVIRWMPLSYAVSGDDLAARASKTIDGEIGYNRVNLSMMLAGACWATLCTVILVRNNLYRLAIIGAASAVALAQALTGGRTGYLTWGVVGLALSVVRWRKLLPIIPIAAIFLSIALPGVRERMFHGFGGTSGNTVIQASAYQITSGRNIAWPRVIEEIKKSPLIGYGRQAMVTTGLRDELLYDLGESFPHPHQAYLELLLDNGILGFLIVIPFFLFVLSRSFRLVLDRDDPVVCAIGCAAFSLILALMIGGFGGQTFYPREGAVGMWAAIGLMLRVYVQRKRALEFDTPLFEDDESYFDDGMALPSREAKPSPEALYY